MRSVLRSSPQLHRLYPNVTRRVVCLARVAESLAGGAAGGGLAWCGASRAAAGKAELRGLRAPELLPQLAPQLTLQLSPRLNARVWHSAGHGSATQSHSQPRMAAYLLLRCARCLLRRPVHSIAFLFPCNTGVSCGNTVAWYPRGANSVPSPPHSRGVHTTPHQHGAVWEVTPAISTPVVPSGPVLFGDKLRLRSLRAAAALGDTYLNAHHRDGRPMQVGTSPALPADGSSDWEVRRPAGMAVTVASPCDVQFGGTFFYRGQHNGRPVQAAYRAPRAPRPESPPLAVLSVLVRACFRRFRAPCALGPAGHTGRNWWT